MRPETLSCLADVAYACRLIEEAVAGVDLEAYLQNWEKQAAVERQLILIGEALNRIRSTEPHIIDSIPDSEKVIGLRHLLVHGYDAVDARAVYALTAHPIRSLLAAVTSLLP